MTTQYIKKQKLSITDKQVLDNFYDENRNCPNEFVHFHKAGKYTIKQEEECSFFGYGDNKNGSSIYPIEANLDGNILFKSGVNILKTKSVSYRQNDTLNYGYTLVSYKEITFEAKEHSWLILEQYVGYGTNDLILIKFI